MLFRKRTTGVSRGQKRRPGIFLAMVSAVMLLLTACSGGEGSIVIYENLKGTGFTMEFKEFSAKNKCELPLDRNDVLQVEFTSESGVLAMTVSGKNGAEPYTGNDLELGTFTVTASEADDYVFTVTGNKTNGKLVVKNLGNLQSR